ncbi:hypothetical protein [Aquirufa sp. A-Brett2-W8]
MAGFVDKVPVERNFNVNFSLEEVKVAMDRLSSSSIHYKIDNKNDVFNSYTMAFVGGVTVVRPTIQLKKVSDTETNIFMNCILREGNTTSQNELLDKYFNLLGSFLSGDEEKIKELETKAKSGCMGIILIGFGLFTSALYFMLN